LATLLGKKQQIEITSTSNMGGKDDGINKENIIHPSSMDEHPDDLHQKLQAKIDADVKAFLKSCDKNQHDRVTQFCEPDFGMQLLLHPRITERPSLMMRYLKISILLMIILLQWY